MCPQLGCQILCHYMCCEIRQYLISNCSSKEACKTEARCIVFTLIYRYHTVYKIVNILFALPIRMRSSSAGRREKVSISSGRVLGFLCRGFPDFFYLLWAGWQKCDLSPWVNKVKSRPILKGAWSTTYLWLAHSSIHYSLKIVNSLNLS